MATSAQPSHASSGPALDNRRLAAAAIDLVAPALALVALYASGLLTLAVALVVGGWTLFYFFALESGGGQTVGKRALKLRVVDADANEPSMRQVAMRTVVRVVDLPVIGLIAMMASGDRRQRLGDMAAETHVVEAAAHPVRSDFSADTHRLDPQVPAAFAEPSDEKSRRPRRSLGGPELKLPKLGRSRTPKQRKPVALAAVLPSFPVAEPAAERPKPGRRTLGGPELKLPKLGRRRSRPAPAPMAELPAAQPLPTPEDPAVSVPDAVEAFGLYDEDQPQPDVEVMAEPWTESESAYDEPAYEAPAEALERSVGIPDVQVTPEPEVSPAPAPPAAIPGISPIEMAPLGPPRSPNVPAALDPERRPFEGDTAEPTDSDGPSIEVKPIETVSAMDLIMQEVEEHRRA